MNDPNRFRSAICPQRIDHNFVINLRDPNRKLRRRRTDHGMAVKQLQMFGFLGNAGYHSEHRG
jgi:hypothetical protein